MEKERVTKEKAKTEEKENKRSRATTLQKQMMGATRDNNVPGIIED